MHMPVHEFLERFTSYEIRELIACGTIDERTRLEAEPGVEGLRARARRLHRQRAREAEQDEDE